MGELLQRIATAAEDRVGDLQLTAKSCMTEGVLSKASGHFVPCFGSSSEDLQSGPCKSCKPEWIALRTRSAPLHTDPNAKNFGDQYLTIVMAILRRRVTFGWGDYMVRSSRVMA